MASRAVWNNDDVRVGLIGLVVGLASWFGIFQWDNSYAVASDGTVSSSPYQLWQYTLAGLVLFGVSGVVAYRKRFAIASTYTIVAMLGFDAGYAFKAHSDVTGLWVFSLIFVSVGLVAGMLLFAACGAGLRRMKTGT